MIDRSVADVAIAEDVHVPPDASTMDADLDAPDSDPPIADAGCATNYPTGPYGTKVGDTIDDLMFIGRHQGSPAQICLGAIHQNPNIQAILVIGSAMWCTPCQSEETPLKNLYASYSGNNVAFVEAILQNFATQQPSMNDLVTWSKQFQQPWDLALDPQMTVAAYATNPACPYHVIIRAKTMKIAYEDVGTDVQALKTQIDAILAD